MEIGQEFEDAEAEEEAALELQKSAYKGMSRADFGGDEDEDGNEDGDEDEDEDEDTEVQAGKKDGRKRSKRGDSGSKGAALATMKNDLEQIALGTAAEVSGRLARPDRGLGNRLRGSQDASKLGSSIMFTFSDSNELCRS